MAMYRTALKALLGSSAGASVDKPPAKKRNKLLGGMKRDTSSSSGSVTCLDLGDGPVLTVIAAQLGAKVLSVETSGPAIPSLHTMPPP
jgi:hypothetical protein